MLTDTLDELRTWPTDRLRAARDEATVEERRWKLRRVALDRALDERGATGGREAVEWVATRDQVRTQTARVEVDVARGLESLPAIAAAAERGELSFDQLEHLVVLATPATDAEWAKRGRATAPSDLSRLVRRQLVVSEAEMAARHEARELRWWRQGEVLQVRGQIPDVHGVFVEAVFEHLIDGMKPTKGQPRETCGRRGADALVQLCQEFRNRDSAPQRAKHKAREWTPRIVVHVGSDAQPEVNGIPISVGTVAQLVADGARVRELHDTDTLAPTASPGAASTSRSPAPPTPAPVQRPEGAEAGDAGRGERVERGR